MDLDGVLWSEFLGDTTSLALSWDFSHIPTLGLFPNKEHYEPGPNGWRRMLGAVSSQRSRSPSSRPAETQAPLNRLTASG